jgi:exopolyphosphatase/guanosine-5'-triphosphate,3'-diphosphate pyrophosphatase
MHYIAAHDLSELRARCGISSTRAELVPYAAEVLVQLMETFRPSDIAISSYGIREGILFEQMPQELRDRDPLIESCRFSEKHNARVPGMGRDLYDFVMPLFPQADAPKRRLIKAACLLHDVNWRAHPDYRAEVCFDSATRADLGGMKHWERVFLGLALLHRYRNKREGTRFSDLYDLLDKAHRSEAEILGKALRFGAMLWTLNSANGLAHLNWDSERRYLRLHLPRANAALFGEVAAARFRSLSAALDALEHAVELDD